MNKAETKLAQSIRETVETGEAIPTLLTTNERVLARITEGIYRQPASALTTSRNRQQVPGRSCKKRPANCEFSKSWTAGPDGGRCRIQDI